MAKSQSNLITQGLTGKIDNLIFRKRGNKLSVYTYTPRTTPDSPAQKMTKTRFQQAILFAKQALANPAIKAQYKAIAQPGQTAHNMAISDFLNAPVIEKINTAKYKGKQGNTIYIEASDKGIITKVEVIIYGSSKKMVEKGEAKASKKVNQWIYAATSNNDSVANTRIVVKVYDLAQNITQAESRL